MRNFILALPLLLLLCNTRSNISHEDKIIAYLYDSLKIPIQNITETKFFGKFDDYTVYLTAVESKDSFSTGYLQEHLCGNYYSFVKASSVQKSVKFDSLRLHYNYNNTFYLAGIELFRGTGYLSIITLNSDTIYSTPYYESFIFDHSLECKCYCENNGWLSREIKDVNNDKIPDILYSGIVCRFCDSLEYGFDRTNRPPLSKNKISYHFVSNSNSNTSRIIWKVKASIN
jgi:hypothetical protein